MSAIGKRAAEAIRKMAEENGTNVNFELQCLYMQYTQLYHYERNVADPGASVLARMAKNGYDVLYILTGEKA
jgi:hypothetical protein